MIKPYIAAEIHDDQKAEDERLRAWLNVLWLRPACALHKSLEMKHMSRFLPFVEPAADLGCGDGTHSAMICGARFHEDFDMYLSIQEMSHDSSKKDKDGIHFENAEKEDEYYKGGDPYLYFKKEAYEGKIKFEAEPKNRFAWGCDLAETLVEKAKLLGLYDKVDVANLCEPLDVPANHFKTVYSNVSYWMDNKEQLFREQHRILTDDGVSLMMAQDPIIHNEIALMAIVRNNLESLGLKEVPKWAQEVDRGRIAQTKDKLLNPQQWNELFEKTGFEMIYFGQYLSRDAYWQYDMDLRETFPADSKLAQRLLKQGPDGARLRREWKRDRIDHFFKKWQQFYQDPGGWQKEMPRTRNFFAIKKKGKKSWADNIVAKYY